jgi:hypothetical protein
MESSEIHVPEARKTGHHLVDMATSLFALLVSSISIYMAYDNGRDMQKLVHASSWPVLQLGSGNNRDGQPMLAFNLLNAGIGPARVHTFEYLVSTGPNGTGKVVVVNEGYLMEQIAEACCAEVFKAAKAKAGGAYQALGDIGTRPISRTFLSPKEVTTALGWSRTEANGHLWDTIDQARKDGRIDMRACYCSVFDECWVAEPNTFPPRKVASCARP